MVARTPLVMVGGTVQELPAADTLINTNAPGPLRRLSYSNGGQCSGLSSYLSVTRTPAAGTTFGFRMPVRLLADTTRWRAKVRFYDQYLSAAGARPLTLTGMAWGPMAAGSAGTDGLSGNFAGGTATTITSTAQPIPNDGSFLTLDWVTAGGTQYSDGNDFCLALGFTAAASTTLLVGVGQSWFWNNATSALNPSVAASSATTAAQFPPLDVVIEYETTTRKRAYLVLGDSIPEGAQGIAYYTNLNASNQPTVNLQPTPLHLGYFEQWAARAGVMVQRNCLFGSTAQQWASPSFGGYGRMDASLGQWDGAFLTLGCNDIAGGTTYSTLLGYYASCIANLRALIGNTVPLYLVNIMPENFPTGANSKELYRLQMNGYLGRKPAGTNGTIDADSAVRGWLTSAAGVSSSNMDYALSCDGIHPSYQGSVRLADAVAAAVP